MSTKQQAHKEEEVEALSVGKQWILVGIGSLVFISCVVFAIFSNGSGQSEVLALTDDVSTLTNQLAVRRTDDADVRQEVIYKSTGIDPELVISDTKLAESFFEPAFTWTDGESYDEARAEYSELLGSDSPFVSTYLAENLKVDEYNYIDLNELMTSFDALDVYALDESDTRMDYMGVITYYMMKSTDDNVDKSTLTTSQAIVRYTIDGTDKDRTVTDVVAYPGFSNLISEE